MTIWDDHEVVNDIWDDGAAGHGSRDGNFASRRAAGMRAYLEWMPVRETIREGRVSLYRAIEVGDLVDILLVDTRLESRDEQGVDTAADPTSTLIGEAQERWLFDSLSRSSERGDVWRILATPVLMLQLDVPDFELDLDGPRIELGFVEPSEDDSSRWELTTRELEGHVIATCIERLDPSPIEVVLHQVDLRELLGAT